MFPSPNTPNSYKPPKSQGYAAQQQTIGGVPSLAQSTQIPGYNFNPYLIQSGDTFKSIADKNNLTEQQIQQANNGMLVPPPAGHYISLPTQPQPNQNGGVGTTPYGPPAPNLTPAGGGLYGPAPTPLGPTAGNPNQFGGAINYAADISNIVASIQSSPETPAAVPGAALSQLTINGQQANAQLMQANGYVYNPATQVWNLKGTAAGGTVTTAAGTGGADFMNTKFMQNYAKNNTPFLQQKRWDPSSHKFVTIGELLRKGKLDLQGRRHKGKGRGKNRWDTTTTPKPQASNAGGTPMTTLNLNLGSG